MTILAFATSLQAVVLMSPLSPVSSRTVQLRPYSNLRFQSAERSEQRDLVGACEKLGREEGKVERGKGKGRKRRSS
jgi:hypothetical protein